MGRAKKDAPAPPADVQADLGSFEGLPVLEVGSEIPSAAGGLREPLKVAPLILHGDDVAFATFELKAGKIRHDPVYNKDDDTLKGWRRVHVLVVLTATFVDEELVREQLDEMAARVTERQEAERLAKEKAKPQQRIEPAIHEKDHEQGRHASGLVADCPACEAEQDAADAEAMTDG